MGKSLNRVVARGVRPHVPYRNINKVRDKLIDKKIRNLMKLSSLIGYARRNLRDMSFRQYGSEHYYKLKNEINCLKKQAEEIRQQEWFIRYKDRYISKTESLYTRRQKLSSHMWLMNCKG